MRQRFEQQFAIGSQPIEEAKIPTTKRSGALPGLCRALQTIFVTPEWNSKVFEILEDKILSGKKKTGRRGMDLWHIFVLAQVRMCQNISYDELVNFANHNSLIRQIMGLETGFGHEEIKFSYQNLIDNLSLLDDETVRKLNEVIVEFGHGVFKKKGATEAFSFKTDSFVVESNVHFPTDYNLLWDCARKSLDMASKLQRKYKLNGWRKMINWRSSLKNKMRALGRACSSGGKLKQERVGRAAKAYLTKAIALQQKLVQYIGELPQLDIQDYFILMELERFKELLEKHIDLLERRIIKGEEIPHSEKIFSIFEEYTEWVNKGKMRPNVELGKKLSITTDQHHLIVDYQIMEHQSDSEIVPGLVKRLCKYKIGNWSFDKGYWHKDNKELLKASVTKVIMPKKGKRNNEETAEEKDDTFVVLRNKHSAIESNINELEYRGLDRCPDRSYRNFKRYIGLAVSAYNLRRIGVELIAQEIAKELQKKKKRKKAA
jgi:hypothetical protein